MRTERPSSPPRHCNRNVCWLLCCWRLARISLSAPVFFFQTSSVAAAVTSGVAGQEKGQGMTPQGRPEVEPPSQVPDRRLRARAAASSSSTNATSSATGRSVSVTTTSPVTCVAWGSIGGTCTKTTSRPSIRFEIPTTAARTGGTEADLWGRGGRENILAETDFVWWCFFWCMAAKTLTFSFSLSLSHIQFLSGSETYRRNRCVEYLFCFTARLACYISSCHLVFDVHIMWMSSRALSLYKTR